MNNGRIGLFNQGCGKTPRLLSPFMQIARVWFFRYFLSDNVELAIVGKQIRTIVMDFWASPEHEHPFENPLSN